MGLLLANPHHDSSYTASYFESWYRSWQRRGGEGLGNWVPLQAPELDWLVFRYAGLHLDKVSRCTFLERRTR